VYGSLSGKLVEETVAPLAPFVEQAILVRPNNPRAMPVAELEPIFSRFQIPAVTAGSVPDALAQAKRLAQTYAQAQARPRRPAMPVVVAGSFYLAGEALKVLGPSMARHPLGRGLSIR